MKRDKKAFEIRRLDSSKSSLLHFPTEGPGRFMWHYHDYFEIFAVTGGGGRWLVGDKSGTLRKGQIFLSGPKLPHSFFNMETDGSIKQEKFIGVVIMFSPIDYKIPELEELRPLFEKASLGILWEDFPTAYRRIGKMLHQKGLDAFIALLKILSDMNGNFAGKQICNVGIAPLTGKNKLDRLDGIYKFLHENYAQNFLLKDLAKRFHMSVSGLCAFFKRSTKKSINAYVHELRISRSCKLLLETNTPVTEIAFIVGYQTISSFNRKFKDIQGISPREYRSGIRSGLRL